MIEKITFEHFYTEVRDELDLSLFRVLSPGNCMFFKAGKSYLALSSDGNNLYINMVAGKGMGFMHELRKMAAEGNLKKVIFWTSEKNKTVQRLADYWHALLIEQIPNYYADGATAYKYEVDLKLNPRIL